MRIGRVRQIDDPERIDAEEGDDINAFAIKAARMKLLAVGQFKLAELGRQGRIRQREGLEQGENASVVCVPVFGNDCERLIIEIDFELIRNLASRLDRS